MQSIIDSYLKPAIRFIYYKEQRAKVFREGSIRKRQDQLIRSYDAATKKLIVFLVTGADYETGVDKISGGTISIVSLCEESARLKNIHNGEVIMCTLPDQHLLAKHTQFNNNTNVFRFAQLRKYFTQPEEIILHIPEFLCNYFIERLDTETRQWLKGTGKVHVNVLNQNIRLMPGPEVLSRFKEFAQLVTATTAHQKYCNQEASNYYQVPVHKFSVWISPEKYQFVPYANKENLVIVSPDEHASRDRIMKKLKTIRGLNITVIQNLTYEEYKATIARAKWAITFGEGLDGYIIEPVFSGAIGFAVFNEEFFTPDFKPLQTIYTSYDEMLEKIEHDMKSLDNEASYVTYQRQQYELCAQYYSHQQYTRNIEAFYQGNYSFK